MSAPEALKEWLKANGAKFDKVDWPSTATVSGERGAVATGDIGTNEVILSIPANLLMAPPAARASALGEILENDNSKDGKLLRGDMDGEACLSWTNQTTFARISHTLAHICTHARAHTHIQSCCSSCTSAGAVPTHSGIHSSATCPTRPTSATGRMYVCGCVRVPACVRARVDMLHVHAWCYSTHAHAARTRTRNHT